MSARVVLAAVAIAGAVAGAAALAYLALSDPSQDTGGGPRTAGGRPVAGTADVPAAPPADPDLAPAPEGGEPWVVVPEYEKELRAIGWDEVGAAYAELVPLLEAHARAVTRARELPADQTARLGALWAELDALVAPMRDRMPYLYGNGVFVQPAVLANSVAATLHARGRGVTREQFAELEGIARSSVEGERFFEQLRNDEHVEAPRRATIECEARRGVAATIDRLLNERQRALLHPPPLRGRVGLDPFDAVEIVRGHISVVPFENDDDGAAAVIDLIARELTFDDLARLQGVELVRGQVGAMGGDMFPDGTRRLDVAGHVDIEHVIIGGFAAAEVLPMVVTILSGGEMPLIPPDVAQRPIILVRVPQD